MSRTVSGLIYRQGVPLAAYFVRWTIGQVALHGVDLHFIIGRWGEKTTTRDRQAVTVKYRNDHEACGFMVIDATETLLADHSLAGKFLARSEVIGTPLAQEIFDMLDFVWLTDERLAPVVCP